jgi:hypothetical protein
MRPDVILFLFGGEGERKHLIKEKKMKENEGK